MYHRPVLLEESLDGLNIQAGGTYLDFTYGGGGHSSAILERLGDGKLIAFDQDPDAEKNKIKDKRLLFIRGNFRYVRNYLRYYGITSIHGALADLGLSSHHIDVAERGFSFRFDSKIDMRMNPEAAKSAVDILNQYPEKALKILFFRYGELKNAGRLAGAVCKARSKQKIFTTGQFMEAIQDCIPVRGQQKYLAKVFQALRIEVNEELESLKQMLEQVVSFMNKGSRLVIITYNSLEDRMAKNFFRSGNVKGTIQKDFYGNIVSPFRQVNRKILQPGLEEIERNPRARSAKLRIAEKLSDQ
ncbi:MAG: 16S rRNA (cytosine(1402)-N(4))-methyltransferase RsmH [Bacteroidales bacterium]|nr:16S rRNA (cytosine(1402)-N(4))-methyltransferase RsmH [Bacteroidales bacterium]